MISIDALVLEASCDLEPLGRRDDAHLNSLLAGAAYKFGVRLTEEMARDGLEKFRKACKKAARVS